MRLRDVLSGIELTGEPTNDPGFPNIDIVRVETDSRLASPQCLFIACAGLTVDGHDYIHKAFASGAAAVLCERIPEHLKNEIPTEKCVITRDTKSALALAVGNFYGYSANKMKLIGVTGTKGKTSTTYFIKSILEHAGKKTGIIGTNGAFLGKLPVNVAYKTSSTPDLPDLYNILDKMHKGGAEFAVMETTSHGLTQRRTEGLSFKVGVFTNLSHDHLDYHKTTDEYLRAKALLFNQAERAVLNADDGHVNEHTVPTGVPIIWYGIDNHVPKGFNAVNVELLPNGVKFNIERFGEVHRFRLGIPGRFTVYNALAAIAATAALGISLNAAAEALEAAAGIPGRFERVENNRDICVIVDYAHSPDSLQNIITAVREFTKGRVITLFGCGGDRDSEKRPVMGRIAGELSDFCVVTSDNPRNENPQDIINQILPGINEVKALYITECDRRKAIVKAINMAMPGDSVILAGKGHEPYQEFENRRREEFDDKVEAKKALGL